MHAAGYWSKSVCGRMNILGVACTNGSKVPHRVGVANLTTSAAAGRSPDWIRIKPVARPMLGNFCSVLPVYLAVVRVEHLANVQAMCLFLIVAALLILRTSAQSAVQTTASYCVGLDVDGTADEWDSCDAPEITLDMMQVGIPDSGTLNEALRVRFAHDGTNVYVLARTDADYHFNLTTGNGFSHSVSVMWQVGENAIMNNMGGCSPPTPPSGDQSDCAAIQALCAAESNTTAQCGNCDASRLTDIWHMETASPGAIPGVQYPWRSPIVFPNSDGTYSSLGYQPEGLGQYQTAVERLFSGNDHTSNSDDEFSVHPCLRGDDGAGSSHFSSFRQSNTRYRNQIRYAWSHSAIDSYMYPFGTIGASGQYIYEFSRPLVTNENTDAQFQVGQNASFAFAFWIPPGVGMEWADANHYVAPSSFQFGTVMFQPMAVTASPCTCNSALSTAKSGLIFAIIATVVMLKLLI